MKKLRWLLLFIVVFSLGITGAEATSFKAGDSLTKRHDADYSVSGLEYDSSTLIINHYVFISKTNEVDYSTYCLDPHKQAYVYGYVVDRILGDPSSSTKIQAYDMGILEILVNGQNQYNNSFTFNGTTVSGNDLYVATSIAVRAFTMIYGYGGDVTLASGQTLASAHANIGAQWAASYRTYSATATGSSCSTTSKSDALACYQKLVQYYYSSWLTSTTFNTTSTSAKNVLAAAEALFELGLEKAAGVAENGGSTTAITVKTNTSSETIEKTEKTTTEYIYNTIKVTNLDAEDGFLNNIKVTCSNCSSNGITIKAVEIYNASTNTWDTLTTSTEAKDYLTESDGFYNGTLRVRIKVVKTVGNSASSSSYTISYDYYDPNSEYSGALLKNRTYTNAQRFVIIEKNDGATTGSATGTFTGATVSCETTISTPICSDDEDEAVATISAPKNVKVCVLDNADDAGNSYQLTTNNGGVSNDYCSVFCKEDYAEIKLNPIVEDVVCGGYFQLTSHVEGSKDCYTGGDTSDKSIDKDLFIEDIIAAQIEMIENYDLYKMYDAAYNSAKMSSNYSCACSACGGTYQDAISEGSYSGYTYTTNESTGVVTVKSKTKTYDFSDDGSRGSCTTTGCDENGENCTQTCTSECTSGSLSELKSELASKRATALAAANDAYEKFVQIIEDYNGCTTAWSNEFSFAQQIKYYYNEYHYDTAYETYYDLLSKANNEDLYYLEAEDGTLVESEKVYVCTGDTDTNYSNCSSGWITLDGSVDDSNLSEYNYNSSYGSSVFKTYNFSVCSGSTSCKTVSVPVSQATYVKKTVEKEQDYITPTAYYQIAVNGKITVNSGYAGNAIQLEALLNSLPVSTSTTGGGIFKLLLEDFGEFYDTGELGRLIDFEGDNENSSVAASLDYVGTFDGEYVCYYESPCETPECPDCEFTCKTPDGGSCDWDECPNCVITCTNCIFNLSELTVSVKTISTTNVYSADRTYGYNWITSSTLTELSLLTSKAETTIEEIEEENEMIYDTTDKDSSDTSLAFSIRLTSAMISDIQEYNEKNEDSGGYANDSLTCYQSSDTSLPYTYLYCYSDLLDELIEDYDDNITVYNRLSTNRENSENSGYWTLWSGYVYSDSVIGGPSWK